MKKFPLIILLALCSAVCLGKIILISIDFASHSLQMDFSAFYTAGESINKGFSPYTNNINQNPSVWDGRNITEFSRFLYPPLTATFFRGIALLPYSVAKFVWVIFILACLTGSYFLFLKIFRRNKTFEVNWSYVIIFTCLFFPLLPSIERGQIDSVTLFILYLALYLILNKNGKGLYAGLLFAVATILKLNCIFLLPFFLLRKRFDVFLGYFIGGILIILASVVFNGFDVTVHYITTDFPRISTYGEDGYTDHIFASDLYPTTGIDPYSVKQGIVYTSSMQNFDGKPNLVQPLIAFFSQHYLNPSMSLISLVVFGFIFLVIVSRERNFSRGKETFKVKDEFLFWQLVLIVILLASPMTWIMNLVWLCPLIFYAMYYYKNRGELNKAWSLYFLIGGLLFVGLPDRSYFPFTLFNNNENIITDILVNYFWSNKYQIGEILLAFFFLIEYRTASREPGAAEINNFCSEDGVEGSGQAESFNELETVQGRRQPAPAVSTNYAQTGRD